MSNEIESQAIIEVTESVTIIETSADINSPIYAEAARASAAEAKASEVSAAEDAAATAADRVQTGLDRQAASDSAGEAKASEQAAKASENAAEQDAQATASDRTYIDGKVAHVDSQVAHVDDQVSHVDEQATFVDQRATDADTSAAAAAASESAASGSAASAAADATQTADDRRQTGEDRTQTGLDRTAASDSATAAAGSAALADQHRQTAAASEANAAQSESAAQDHLNAFLDRYYGDYSAPPTESPTGNSPEVGDLYFDTTEGALKIWTSAGWRNATTVVEGVYDVHEYRDQAGNNSFALDYDVGLLQVLYNGVQLASDDFTANNGTSVVLAKAVSKNTDVITLIRWGAVTQATFIGTAAREDVEAFDPAGAAAQAETNAKAYTDMEIASLVAAAPGALDTLNELAQAMGDDPNFAATMTNALAQKLDASAYTASDVLAKLLTVDGSGSGLDADLLDGQPGYLYARRDQNNTVQTDSGGVRLVGADDRGYLQGLNSAGENGGLWLTGILGAKAPRIELYSDQVTVDGSQVLHGDNTGNAVTRNVGEATGNVMEVGAFGTGEHFLAWSTEDTGNDEVWTKLCDITLDLNQRATLFVSGGYGFGSGSAATSATSTIHLTGGNGHQEDNLLGWCSVDVLDGLSSNRSGIRRLKAVRTGADKQSWSLWAKLSPYTKLGIFALTTTDGSITPGPGVHQVAEPSGTFNYYKPILTAYNSNNVVGNIASEHEGFPVGGLFERGSNSNGRYVKFADGTAIAYGFFGLDPSVREVTVPFPITFDEPGAAAEGGVYVYTGGYGAGGNYRASIDAYAKSASSMLVTNPNINYFQGIHYMAIGHWKR